MKNAQSNLKRRLHGDTIANYFVTAGLAVCAVIRMINYFIVLDSVKIVGESYVGTAPASLLADAILFLLAAVAMLLLSRLLGEIHKTGKPFSQQNVKRLRGMAGVLIMASLSGEFARMITDVLASGFSEVAFRFGTAPSLAVLVFGVVCGLVSEIFSYGCALQDDVDAIA